MQPTAPSERRQTTVAPLELARAMRGLKENSVSYTATTMEQYLQSVSRLPDRRPRSEPCFESRAESRRSTLGGRGWENTKGPLLEAFVNRNRNQAVN